MTPFKRILVPLDGSLLAEKALRPALDLAASMSAEVRVLHVIAPPDFMAHTVQLQRFKAELANMAREEAELYLKRIRSEYKNDSVALKTETVMGAPAKTIIDRAAHHDIDLIVMSSHGRSGISRWFYGSVAEKVLHGAPCAILIIRGTQENQETVNV